MNDELLKSDAWDDAGPGELRAWLSREEEYYHSIRRFILSSGGSEQDAEDTIQEGIFRLLANIDKGTFRQDSSLKTYLFNICRNIWISQLRRQYKWREVRQALAYKDGEADDAGRAVHEKDRQALIDKALAPLSGACRQVLRLWSQGHSMEEIARMAGYSNAGSAKKKRSVCMKKLVEFLKERPQLRKELLNHIKP
ncbi:MAG: sigma-70 family RNA polymerase sigma factor [Phaeodactylibacter sp.]|nr:sigma-70 family RNA polymerase sigma factor [Phaeodactylibacter sp.]